jgi:hypothetical protein
MTTTTLAPTTDYGVPPGKYGLAARYYNSRRDVYSGMSVMRTLEVEAGNAHFSAPALSNDSPSRGFDQIQTFRTIDAGNRLYLEATWDSGEVPTWAEDLSDEAIQYQTMHEPIIDEVRRPPTSRRISYYQGVTLAEDLDLRAIVYSPTHVHQPEVFNSTNISRVGMDDGKLVEFVPSGDILFALFQTLVRRYIKQGTACVENDLHRGWGPTSRSASAEVAGGLMTLAPCGVVSIPPSGPPQLHAYANRLFIAQYADSWCDDIEADVESPLPNIYAAADDLMRCVFFVNRAKSRCVVYWTDTQRVSMLEGFGWTLGCSGTDPVAGGARRAWFHGMEIQDSPDTSFAAHNDTVWTADALLQADTQTMLGLSSGQVLNGAATAPSSGSVLTCAGAGWTSECVGAFVHVFSGYGEAATNRRRGRVISAAPDSLTLYPSVGPIAIGDEFHVSCIPMVVVDTPVMGAGPQTDLSFRRLVMDMNLCLGRSLPPTAGSYIRMAVVGEDMSTELAAKAVAADCDYDMLHGNVNASARIALPKWESYWSDEPLEWYQGGVKFRRGESDVS